jgi:hypothetical protein
LTAGCDCGSVKGPFQSLVSEEFMRPIVSTLLIAVFAALPAWAGLGQDNPGLLDVESFFYSYSPAGASYNYAFVLHGSTNTAHGAVESYVSSGDDAEIFWLLYEPDTVKRLNRRGRQTQSSYVLAGFYTWATSGGGSWDETTTENCRATTRVEGDDGTPEEAFWRVTCNGALEAMGVSQSQADRLDALLGRYVNTSTDRISIKGKGPVGGPM